MNDQYDLFCIQKINEARDEASSQQVTRQNCGCADYLGQQGYAVSPEGVVAAQAS